MTCSSDITKLWQFSQNALPAGEREEIERHLTACRVCRDTLSQWEGTAQAPPPDRLSGELAPDRQERLRAYARTLIHSRARSSSRLLSPVFRRPVWAAACILAAFGIAGFGVWMGRSSDDAEGLVMLETVSSFPVANASGVTVPAGETLRSQEKGLTLRFADQSRVRMEPQSEGEWEALQNGGYRFRLHRGEVKAEIVSGGGGFEVKTPAGTVEVLGTRFSARLIEVPVLEEGDSPLQGLAVDLQEGVVRIGSQESWKTLTGFQRGVVVPGRPPYPMERLAQGGTPNLQPVWENLVRTYADGNRTDFAFFLTVLGCHREAGVEFLRSRLESSGTHGECARLAIRSLD